MPSHQHLFTTHRIHRLKWVIFSALIAIALAISGLSLAAGTASSAGQVKENPVDTPAASTPVKFAPGVVLVGFKDGIDPDAWLRALKSAQRQDLLGAGETGLNIQAIEPVFPQEVAKNSRLAGLDQFGYHLAGIQRVRLAAGGDVLSALKILGSDPALAYAEPDYLAQAVLLPNDPRYPQQWGLAQIGAPAAWDANLGADSTVIAIVDSGIDRLHEDLASQVWVNPGETPGNGVDDDENGYIDDVYGWNFLDGNGDTRDDNGHGTQVAGIAGAAGNNAKGIAGMCWNCRLMAVKVMQSSGLVNYSDIAAGVAYAAAQGAQVINLSLGGYADSVTLRSAIQSAGATAVIVAGAGNDNLSTPFYPAAYPEVLAIASTDSSNHKADFSNYGSWVNLAAPGVDIQTTFAGNNTYGAESGTSLSAPFAAGAAGLLVSKHPDWPVDLVRQHLLNTGADLDAQNPAYAGGLGHGLLAAGQALSQAPRPQLAVTGWSLEGGPNIRPAPGGSYSLVLDIQNTWLPVRGLAATLSESDPYVTVGDAAGSFGDLNTLGKASNSSDPFAVTLAGNTPYNHPIQFTLSFSGEAGYVYSLPFTLTVRSGEEHLAGGTTYIEDETWTADKTYFLDGNIIVGTGVTLTVQEGTQVFVKPGSWMRVDGTLLADATAEQPIVFTTQTPGQRWAGLRFTDSSGAARFDVDGNYLSGSLLRYVELSEADTGVSMLSQGVYILHSTFTNNTLTVNTGSSAARIEYSTFNCPSMGIQMDGGNVVIRGNKLTGKQYNDMLMGGSGLAGNLSGGSILNNDIQDFSSLGIAIQSGNIQVMGNRLIGNGSGLSLDSSGNFDVSHNLIANNVGLGASLNASYTWQERYPVDLVYNPDRNEYLLVWRDGTEFKVQRLSSYGDPLGSAVQMGSIYNDAAKVVYNPIKQEYLLTWVSPFGASQSVIKVQRFNSLGELADTSHSVVNLGSSMTYLSLVYRSSSNDYLVAWNDQTNWPAKLRARLVSADGLPNGEEFSFGDNISPLGPLSLAYDSTGQRTLAVYRGDLQVSPWCSGCILGEWLAPEVTTTTLPAFGIQVINSNVDEPKAAFLPGSPTGLITWKGYEYSGNNSSHLYSWPVEFSLIPTSTQIVTDYLTLYTSTVTLESMNLIAAPEINAYLAAWRQPANGGETASIRLGKLGSNGNLIAAPGIVHDCLSTQGCGQLDFINLAWNNFQSETMALFGVSGEVPGWRIAGQQLSADGSQLDAPWSPGDESDLAIAFEPFSFQRFEDNTLINNAGGGLSLNGEQIGKALIQNNNWFGNGSYDVSMQASSGVTATVQGNYWGEIPTSQIAARIYDCNDTEFGCGSSQTNNGVVLYNPPLKTPEQNAPAFVRKVDVSPDPMGIQRGTFQVEFSRPMLTGTLPVLSFHDARQGHLEQPSELAGVNVSAMAEDALGRMWFGCWDVSSTLCGAWRYDGSDWEHFTSANSGLASNNIQAIFGAANGDVWFSQDLYLSRLSGTSWITYTSSQVGLSGVTYITEDSFGETWFQSWGRVARFDGTTFTVYDSANSGFADGAPLGMAADAQGRVWVAFDYDPGSPGQASLSVFDGKNWQHFTSGHGLPDGFTPKYPFVDSKGDLWIGSVDFSAIPTTHPYYAARYRDGAWTYYNSANTDGVLNCYVNGFGEDPRDGRLLMNACSIQVFYDGQEWTKDTSFQMAPTFQYDHLGNLWFEDGLYHSGLEVLWGGLDYPVLDGAAWISPTLFQASYDMTPLVPRGTYSVSVSGAIGMDLIETVQDESRSFLVDYAGSVSDDTPPSKPSVKLGSDGSLNKVSLHWSSIDPQGIMQFRYALGTTPGGRDVIDWRYLPGSSTGIDLNGLLLVKGQTYYAVVAAQNTSGLWSQNGISNPLVAGNVTNPGLIFLPVVIGN